MTNARERLITWAQLGGAGKEDNAEHTHVFVYGSLMEGFGNHDILKRNGARLVGNYTFESGLLIDLGAFPAAVTSQEGVIHGELYEVSDASDGLFDLDTLESFDPEQPENSLYIRRTVVVNPEEGDRAESAQMYFWNTKRQELDVGLDYDIVQSGDWRTDHGSIEPEMRDASWEDVAYD